MSIAAIVTAVGFSGCVHLANPPGTRPTAGEGAALSVDVARLSPDPETRSSLMHVAQEFNDDYDNGRFGAAWDRWDARSRTLITRTEYIRRHNECAPASGATARVEGAEKQPDGSWHVDYEIDHVQLVDTWYYVRSHWVFDIVESNPQAARRYAMPFDEYAAAVGCTVH